MKNTALSLNPTRKKSAQTASKSPGGSSFASTSGLKKKMRTPTASKKKKRRGRSLSSIDEDVEDVDSDGDSSGSCHPQSRNKSPTKRHCVSSIVSKRRRHYDSDDDSSAFSTPQSRKTSLTKQSLGLVGAMIIVMMTAPHCLSHRPGRSLQGITHPVLLRPKR